MDMPIDIKEEKEKIEQLLRRINLQISKETFQNATYEEILEYLTLSKRIESKLALL